MIHRKEIVMFARILNKLREHIGSDEFEEYYLATVELCKQNKNFNERIFWKAVFKLRKDNQNIKQKFKEE